MSQYICFSFRMFLKTHIAEGEKGIDLKKTTTLVSDQKGFIINGILFSKFQKKSTYYNECKFYDTVVKKIRSLFICSLQKQIINKGLTFTSGPDTYKIEISDDSRTIKKTF